MGTGGTERGRFTADSIKTLSYCLPNSMSEHGDDGERRGKLKGLLKEWDLEHRQNKVYLEAHMLCLHLWGHINHIIINIMGV